MHLHSKKLAAIPAGRRTKFLIVLAWIAVMVALGPAASRITDVEENDAIAFLPRSAESTQVAELQERFQSEDPPAVVVYARNGGITPADRAAAERDRADIAALDHIGSLGPIIPSQDGKALLLPVPIQTGGDEKALTPTVDRLREIVGTDPPAGLETAVTGPAGGLIDMVRSFDGVDTTLLLAAAGVVALLLLLTYRSPVLWLLPLVVVGVGDQVAKAVVTLLAENADLAVNVQSAGLLTVLAFGAGTDYALLLLARYREELHHHEDRHAAMATALRTAGPAILASSATVAVGLLCLLAAELNSNRGLGPVAAIGVLCAYLVMITLLPALLVVFGRWVFWPFWPRFGTPGHDGRGLWAGVGNIVSRRPRLVWGGTALVLVGLAFAATGTGMQTGLSAEQSFRTTPESVIGQRLVTQHFPAGSSDPAQIVASAAAAGEVVAAVRATSGVAEVLPETRAGGLVLIPAVLSDAPDTEAAEATIERLRDAVHAVPGADAIVGGSTAIVLDTRTAQDHDRRLVIPLVLLVVLVVLALLLRSLVAPVLLVATVVLSFFAAAGASYLVFDLVFGWTAVDHSVLLLGFVFLVALGVDYNIFLMHRVREEAGRIGHRAGVLRGLAVTGGVITSAGLVLAATFSVLGVLPLVSMTQLGVLVALGVLLDTFVVRSILVPALALDAGRATWWPGRLAQRPTASAVVPDLVGAGAD